MNEKTEQDVVRLLTILVKRERKQSDLISEMSSVGFKPTRIAELLDTTANTVNVALSRIKRKN